MKSLEKDEIIYDNHITVAKRNWGDKQWDIVISTDAVALFYMDPRGVVYLTKQYRPAIGGHSIAVPAETMEKQGTPRVQAVRGLREECGISIPVDNVEHVMSIHSSEGHDTEQIHLYRACCEGMYTGQDLDADEDITVIQTDLWTTLAQIADGKIKDAKTIILAQHELIRRVE